MITNFLFWFLFSGTIIASLQDIKRREIDRWLNYTLITGSIIFLAFKTILTSNPQIILQGIFVFAVLFIFSNLLYYAKFFAGGDSSLFFAISALFIGPTILVSTLNILSFIVFLLFSGSVYGLIYSGGLYLGNIKTTNHEMKKLFKNTKQKYLILISIPFIILSFYNSLFISLGIMLALYPLLFIFTKSLEKTALTKIISGNKLTLGDWLDHDVKIKGKIIKSVFSGLRQEDLDLLKNRKKVTIKQGLPFAPAFTIAMILYFFLSDKLITTIFTLFI